MATHLVWILRLVPVRWRTAVYYRFFRSRRADWPDLFRSASLHFAPRIHMSLSTTDEAHGCIAFTGFYELGLSRLIINQARRGGWLVDVGANYGYFSLLWAAAHPQNRVTAFEASPRNWAPLADNLRFNRLESRVAFVPQAVGDHSGTVHFDVGPPEQTGWGGISPEFFPQTVAVPSVRLDDHLPADAVVDVLKIDIEGADSWALLGAQRLLRHKQVRHIYYEQNLPRMKNLQIPVDLAENTLRQAGYQVRSLTSPDCLVQEFEAWPNR